MTLKEILSGKVAVRIKTCGEWEEFKTIPDKYLRETFITTEKENNGVIYIIHTKINEYHNGSFIDYLIANGYKIITFDELKERLKCQTDI